MAEKAKAAKPSYMEMAKEAIVALADGKGSSVPAIQTHIAGKYALDLETVKVHLKPALAKGLENGTFVRPKNSDAKGYTGRFKVNKIKAAEEAKVKALKEKAKLVKEKAAEKKAAGQKSPKKKVVTPKTKKPTDKKSPKKVKKSPTMSKAEQKPKAAKSKLKTPRKTPKKLKTLKTATPATAKK